MTPQRKRSRRQKESSQEPPPAFLNSKINLHRPPRPRSPQQKFPVITAGRKLLRFALLPPTHPLFSPCFALLFLSLLLAFPGQTQHGEEGGAGGRDALSRLAAAAEAVRTSDWERAAEGALAAAGEAAALPLQGRSFFLAGFCEYKLKRYEAARTHLRQGGELYPFLAPHALFYTGLCFQAEANYAQAAALWEQLIALQPPGDLLARTWMELLRLHRRNGKAAEAAAALARLEALSWKKAEWKDELTYSRGWVLAQQGAKTEARAILLRLWKERPESFWADQAEKLLTARDEYSLLAPGETTVFTDSDRLERIRVLKDHHHPGKALAELSPLIEAAEKRGRSAELIKLYQLRAELALDKRDFSRALSDLERAASLAGSEDVEILYLQARAHHRAYHLDEALSLYRRVYTVYPSSNYVTRALYYAARLLKLKNDWAGAESHYKRLVSGYPTSTLRPESLFQLAWLRYLQGDPGRALLYLEQVPQDPSDPDFNARTWYWKAVCARQTGAKAKAEEAETYILKNHWKSVYAYYLVFVEGRPWPYPPGSRPWSPPPAELPREFRLARELYLLGLAEEAEGQLDFLADRGGLSEWLISQTATMYRDLGDYYQSQRLVARQLRTRLSSPPPAEREAWQLAYPQAYPTEVEKWTKEYNLDPYLVWALMRAESTYRPAIISPAGAVGVMQIMPDTGAAIARALGEKGFERSWLKEPAVNIRYGCFYLHNRLKEFHCEGNEGTSRLSTLVRALAAYNAGPQRVRRWAPRADALGLSPMAFVEEIPIQETRDYVKRILGFRLLYHFAYEAEGSSPRRPPGAED